MKIKGQRSFETSVTIYWSTQLNIPEDLNLFIRMKRNVGDYLLVDTAQRFRRLESVHQNETFFAVCK